MKCAVLDPNGKRCNSAHGTQMTSYPGAEFYSHFDEHPATWVTVPMCAEHDLYRDVKTRTAARKGTR